MLSLQQWLAAADLLGLVVLAWPALRLDRLGKLIHDVSRASEAQRSDPFWQDYLQALAAKLARQRDGWTWVDRSCLWGGYLVLLLAAVVKLVTAP